MDRSKPDASSQPKKQLTLKNWFEKASNASTKGTKKLALKSQSVPAKSRPEPKTPESERVDASEFDLFVAKSSVSSDADISMADTPPTSDVVDVDMLSADKLEDNKQGKRGYGKRKIVLDDSDEENGVSVYSSTPPSASKGALPTPGKSSAVSSRDRAKRVRVSILLSDDDEEEEARTSLVQKLSQYKQVQTRTRATYRSAPSTGHGEDDDFIAPSDDETDAKSIASHRRSSSRSSYSSEDYDCSRFDSDKGDDEKDIAGKRQTKPKKFSAKETSTKSGVAGTASSVSAFLTAAEQRAEGKKMGKKATENPFVFLTDVQDKDGFRPGDPQYDPRTLLIPKESWKEFTPFEKQFWEIKQNHYDTVLFFQKGKFLELYEDDAWIGHREFDLKITKRVKMSMVGVPESSFNFWAAKFIAKGYKVGRVDQAETALGAEMRLAAAKSKGKVSEDSAKEKIVRRELNKVYTNGTLVDGELLTDDQAGHCISICEQTVGEGPDDVPNFGICVLDTSTSQFNLSAFRDDVCRTKLETLLRQLRPKELLFTKGSLSVSTSRLLKSVLPATCLWTGLRSVEGFDYDETIRQLNELYPTGKDDDMEDDYVLSQSVPQPIKEMVAYKSAIQALGATIWYLRQLNIDKDILSMKNFNVYDPLRRDRGLVLDGQTLAHVEVLLNNEGTEDGSLLKLLNRCITPSGKRLFRIWLCTPLRNISEINARLDAVQDILDQPVFEKEFNDVAKGLPDLERIVSRVHAKNCKVKDFLKVLNAFKKLSIGLASLADSSESFESKTILGLLRSAPDLSPNIKNVQRMYKKPYGDNDMELEPQDGNDEEYDEVMAEIKDLEGKLDQELKAMEKKLGIALSYWHSAQGNKEIYMVQTKSDYKDVPKNWTKSGGTKTTSRWLVPSLQTTIRSLKEARENRSTSIKKFAYRVFAEFDADRAAWLRAIRVLAELDCLFSLAKSSSAIGEPVCRPEFVEGDGALLDFEELRYAALDLRSGDFIPNDVKLGGNVGKVVLLTGPNMAGKSTVMRMTAAGVIMAQLGMLVPAKKARLCPVDAILTRMGAYDNMFSNASTFKVELDECCKILRDATPKSLVILDELGRGTSTFDGMAIAGAVLHQLATHTLPLAFFATHYGSLTDDFAYHPNIRRMHMATLVDDTKRDLTFLFKLVEGVAESSFGTHVANLAGVPRSVVDRADVVSKDFAKQFKQRMAYKKEKSAFARLPLVVQVDFVYLYGLVTGKVKMPEDPVRRREVLARLKECMRRNVER